MQRFDTLIRKFWDHSITTAELTELKIMLEKHEHLIGAESKQYFYQALAGDETGIEPARAGMIMHAIRTQIGPEKITPVKRLKSGYIWLAAASLLAICVSVFLITGKPDEKPGALAVVKTATSVKRKVLINKGDTIMPVTLEDGSLVKIYPNSRLSFTTSFNDTRRDIDLQGKAFFQVAKDRSKPFTVYANHFSTTALGTAFTVDAKRMDKVSVKLYEGKVVIRSTDNRAGWKDQYLVPDEEFAYNLSARTFTISNFGRMHQVQIAKNSKQKPVTEKAHENNMLSFSNAPLKKVFRNLTEAFKVRFEYKEEDMSGLYFTGSFSAEEPLPEILAIICNINGLVYTDQGRQVIVITKSK